MAETDALALDARSLARLKESAARDPKGAARRAAVQFEAMLMQMVLKSMRDAVPQSGMLEGPGSDLYKGMLDTQFAQTLSGQPSGLGAMIERQLLRSMETGGPAARSPQAPGAGVSTVAQGAPVSMGSASPRSGPAAPISMAGLPPAIAQRAAAAFAQAAAAERAAEPNLAPMPMVGANAPGLGGAPSGSPNAHQIAFVRRTWSAAQAAERATGVPASFVLGQAALETGWGRSEIKHPDGRSAHNLFGIKADARWRGAVVESPTTEYINGRAERRVERFRAYANDAEAFADWSRLMLKSPRYQAVLQHGGDVQTFARGIQRAGYATDPAYASKLARTITQAMSLRRSDT